MNKRIKLLLTSIMATSLLVGCEKNNDIETTEEYLLAETSEEVAENETNDTEENLDEDASDDKDEEQKEEVSSSDSELSTSDKDKINSNKVESNKTDSSKPESNKTQSNTVKEETVKEEVAPSKENEEDNIVLVSNPVFTKSEITESLKARMTGKSMKENDSITFDDLSYLTITYLDYNGKTQQGEMVVHKKLADEVLDIFRDIYYAKFPIERMSLIDDYNAVDHTSMVNNNSSAFCYRTIAGTNKVSNHGMGMAIDINPFYNPHVLKSSGTVNPVEASKYANRNLNAKGMIKVNDVVYKAFTSRGWTWGGHWKNPDYQHFEKKI